MTGAPPPSAPRSHPPSLTTPAVSFRYRLAVGVVIFRLVTGCCSPARDRLTMSQVDDDGVFRIGYEIDCVRDSRRAMD
ncbi:hypothetical protein LNO89_21220 [Klebsiella pneumoniae subsp. pneumoniae]|nr:hypothetical protein [Klebsiella pneumoniae subsp. pneumoniae]